MSSDAAILMINSGSSNLKFAIFANEDSLARLLSGALERIGISHLGNGASTVRDGRSIETTMGFSTVAGLIMGTRCGDIDPRLVLYLLNERGLSTSEVETALYERSGLLGVSGLSSDTAELLAPQDDPAAREAVDLFCYRARRHLAALMAVLGGWSVLYSPGGTGTNTHEVRSRICRNLAHLDHDANSAGRSIISDPDAAVVETVGTDKALMIAHHVRRPTTNYGTCRDMTR